MTPDYYRTTDASDLYDLWRQHYGTETACRHLEMSAQEYLYRAPEKGTYLADLAKVQTIVQRLLEWGESPEGQTKTPACDTREPLLTREQLLRQLREEGYGLVRPADPTQPDPPPPAIVSHAELTQRMAQAIDHRDEALAAQHGERITLHEARARARQIAEDAEAERQADLQRDWPDTAQNGERITLHEARAQATQVAEDAEEAYCRALAEDIVRVGTEIDQWMHALRKEQPFPRAAETVLAHCVDADQARQGVAVATEIRALLTHYGIPADSPYGDWSSELARHEPQRWPDTTAQTESEAH